MLASVGGGGSPYTGLKSLIKGWQNFLTSCVVPKRSLLSRLLSSLITEGVAGGLCSSPRFSMTSFIAVALTRSACFLIGVFEGEELVQKARRICSLYFPSVDMWTLVNNMELQ